MSCRHKELIDIDFYYVQQYFKLGNSAIRQNGAFLACSLMTKRGISSMPTGMVIAALVVIALVAFAAMCLLGGSSEGAFSHDIPPAQIGQ